MYQGGEAMNKRTIQILRITGLVIPIILFIYALLARYNIVTSSSHLNDGLLYGIMLPWLALATLLFFMKTTRFSAALYIIAHHLFAVAYIVLISGFTTPILITWVVLLAATYGFFSRLGVYVSALLLVIAAAIDSLSHPEDPTLLASSVAATTTTLVVGIVIVKLAHAQATDSAELERTKAQEMLQRDQMLTIVNNLTDAVLSTDRDGIIRIYNAASLNLLDTNSSLVGQHINHVLPVTNQEGDPVDVFADLSTTHSVVIRDDLALNIQGELLRLETTYTPIRSSFSQSKQSQDEDGYILILRDVTKAKSLEEERDEFISVVSHELRTPITIAEGTISNVLLMMERDDTAKDRLPAAVTTAHEQIIFLSKMVNDLSTLSRAERGVSDELELIDVKQLCNDLFHEYSPQAHKKKLTLDLDLDPNLGSVHASPLYLKELLQNFITNAIKYTKEGTVTLRVARKKDTLTLAVSDTGIGMSKTDQAKIFNKFYRSEDYRTRETGGTGLGLYVATKLARKLNTDIHLESRLNYGSTFSFSLPVHKK